LSYSPNPNYVLLDSMNLTLVAVLFVLFDFLEPKDQNTEVKLCSQKVVVVERELVVDVTLGRSFIKEVGQVHFGEIYRQQRRSLLTTFDDRDLIFTHTGNGNHNPQKIAGLNRLVACIQESASKEGLFHGCFGCGLAESLHHLLTQTSTQTKNLYFLRNFVASHS